MKTNLNINIATDEYGKDLVIDLGTIKHLFVAGNIGTGKSVVLHNIICTLISNNSPQKIKFMLSDPKQVELNVYNGIPHLLTPVIRDQKRTILALKWAGKEMNRRLDILKDNNSRNIEEYHKDTVEHMPHIVIVIDELSDITQVYPKEIEAAVVKILEMGHIVGIHLILSTSRPNTKIFTKPMRDLIGTRIALQTTSAQDSKSVIGTIDACGLKGEGHMLYREGMKYIIRGQASFISVEEIKKVVKFQSDSYRDEVMGELNLTTPESDRDAVFSANFDSDNTEFEPDELYDQAKQIVVESGKASTSYIQRRLSIGYSRAAKLIDMLEERGVIGPANGSAAREVCEEEEEK
jgi:S-DNA-T family DNA segregation ATPase FtsK/SpoIIIE